ncbi:MAG: sensor histidine kinase [Longimicrobiales bacterium]
MTEKGRATEGTRAPDSAQGEQSAVRELAASSNVTLFGIVAHELRSPIAAILGYEELLTEGLLGTVDERAREALARIRSSARQLLTLTEGMHELSGRDSPPPFTEQVDHAELLRATVERGAAEAEARRVTLDLSQMPDAPVRGASDPQLLENVLDAAFGAALKTSTSRTLTTTLDADGPDVVYRIRNTGLDADTLDLDRIDSGAALRIRIASRMLGRVGGTIRLRADASGTTIELIVPKSAP